MGEILLPAMSLTMKLVLFALAAVTLALPTETEVQELFGSFIRAYNKTYSSETEFNHRLSVFNNTLRLIDERNADGEAEHGINKFADMSPAEFRDAYLGYRPRSEQGKEDNDQTPEAYDPSKPASIDWRSKGVLTPVKDQQQCGSCWAFSATEQIETNWKMAGNKLVSLSPQQIVSCDKTDDGCNGGNTETAYKYVVKAGGLE